MKNFELVKITDSSGKNTNERGKVLYQALTEDEYDDLLVLESDYSYISRDFKVEKIGEVLVPSYQIEYDFLSTYYSFLEKINRDVVASGWQFQLYLEDRNKNYSGFCDFDKKIVSISLLKNDWFEILIHEYCHFLQYRDGFILEDDARNEEIFWEWLDGKREDGKDYWKRLYDIECDCDKRVVKLIKDKNLPIDVLEYTKKSNAYHNFYKLLPKYRKWYRKNAPYRVKEIIELMPDSFDSIYDELAYEDLCLKYCL